MAMTLRLTDSQAEALRKRAEREHSSMHSVVLRAVDTYLAEDDRRGELDAIVDRIVTEDAGLLHRLAQ